MTDLSENTSDLSEGNEVSNTDIAEQLSDADIDANNEAFAEAEDLENTCETLGENLESDEVAQSRDEVAAELQDEPVENTDRLEAKENNTHDSEKDALSDNENDDISENNAHEVSEENETGTVAENETVEQVGNSEQLEEPSEPEPQPNPWDDAPADCYFYDKTYEDGHLGSYTESAETAYKMGWDIEHNYILIADTEKSDVNGWTYPKELCPHKSERDLQIEVWSRAIFELKEELNRTDYKAIKYAEGVLTDEEYQETGIQRQVWRKRINELEKMIAG